MGKGKTSVVILLAEDDDDDYVLTKDAFAEARMLNKMLRVKDGEELLDYLYHRGTYGDPETSPRPSIILLDLNMPRKDGREALTEIKADPDLRNIPVIILTVSKLEEDIIRTYDLGASSFIRKPVRFNDFVEVLKIFERYWFEVVELPK